MENLGDVFTTFAFPTIEDTAVTFAIIFLQRAAENLASLGFQLDIWFRFRIWIKGKFKKDQVPCLPRACSCSLDVLAQAEVLLQRRGLT